jgi:hypothetical protein
MKFIPVQKLFILSNAEETGWRQLLLFYIFVISQLLTPMVSFIKMIVE